MNWRTGKCVAAGLALALATVGVAQVASAAATEIQFDINSISIQAKDGTGANAFGGTGHTGTLQFVADANSTLSRVHDDGGNDVTSPVIPAQLLGTVNVSGGTITGGSLTASFGSPATNSLSFSVVPNTGIVENQVGQTFKFIADAGSLGFANGSAINGVPITDFAGQPLEGALTVFNFTPGAAGFSDAAQAEISVFVVPEPATVGLLGLAGLGLMARRRRRGA